MWDIFRVGWDRAVNTLDLLAAAAENYRTRFCREVGGGMDSLDPTLPWGLQAADGCESGRVAFFSGVATGKVSRSHKQP